MHLPSRIARSMFRAHPQSRQRLQAKVGAPRLYSRRIENAGAPPDGVDNPSAPVPRQATPQAVHRPRLKALHLPDIVFWQGTSASEAATLLLPP